MSDSISAGGITIRINTNDSSSRSNPNSRKSSERNNIDAKNILERILGRLKGGSSGKNTAIETLRNALDQLGNNNSRGKKEPPLGKEPPFRSRAIRKLSNALRGLENKAKDTSHERDANSIGKLGKELRKALRNLGRNPSTEDLKDVLKLARELKSKSTDLEGKTKGDSTSSRAVNNSADRVGDVARRIADRTKGRIDDRNSRPPVSAGKLSDIINELRTAAAGTPNERDVEGRNGINDKENKLQRALKRLGSNPTDSEINKVIDLAEDLRNSLDKLRNDPKDPTRDSQDINDLSDEAGAASTKIIGDLKDRRGSEEPRARDNDGDQRNITININDNSSFGGRRNS